MKIDLRDALFHVRKGDPLRINEATYEKTSPGISRTRVRSDKHIIRVNRQVPPGWLPSQKHAAHVLHSFPVFKQRGSSSATNHRLNCARHYAAFAATPARSDTVQKSNSRYIPAARHNSAACLPNPDETDPESPDYVMRLPHKRST